MASASGVESAITLSTTQCSAGIESANGEIRVRLVGRGDDQQLDGGVLEGLIEAGVTAHVPELLGLGSHHVVAGHDPVEAQFRLPLDEWAMEITARQTVANHNCPDHRQTLRDA